MVSRHLTCQRSHLHDVQAAATTEKPQAKLNQYELQTLTTWLLKVWLEGHSKPLAGQVGSTKICKGL